MQREFAVWDDIDVHFKGEVVTSGGHGFAAMSRRRLLEILQERCAEPALRSTSKPRPPTSRSSPPPTTCGGRRRAQLARPGTYADTFRPTLEARDCKYIWLGTDKVFDAFKFDIPRRRTA